MVDKESMRFNFDKLHKAKQLLESHTVQDQRLLEMVRDIVAMTRLGKDLGVRVIMENENKEKIE